MKLFKFESESNLMQLQSEERQAIGHDFSNMIKACTFKQRDCLNSRYPILVAEMVVHIVKLQ